jgi:hypothetical protein
MFPARFHNGLTPPRQVPSGPLVTGLGRWSWVGAVVRLGLLPGLLLAAVPGVVSAQSLGTMQVTARVLPGRPGWAGLSEARGLTRNVLSAPWTGTRTHRAGLVLTRAELAPAERRRRLLVTIHYPHN